MSDIKDMLTSPFFDIFFHGYGTRNQAQAQAQTGQSQYWQAMQAMQAGQAQHTQQEIAQQANTFGVEYLTEMERIRFELDKEFPSIQEGKRYVEPFYLRFLRWLVRIL